MQFEIKLNLFLIKEVLKNKCFEVYFQKPLLVLKIPSADDEDFSKQFL